MKYILKRFSLITLLLCTQFSAFSQNESTSTDLEILDLFEMDLESLMNIKIVSASKKAENNFDSPLSMSVITEDEIRNSGATTIEEIFRLVPGFIVREKTNGNFDIHIRGNDNAPPGNYIFNSVNSLSLVMIDGRKVYNQMNGGTFWETLPISITDIQQIEIIRGPSAALYGPNAVSGVINIITKKGLADDKKFVANASAQGGTNNSTIANLSLGTKIKKLSIRVSGNYDHRNRFEDTYYNYILGKYTSIDSLLDWQSTSSEFVSKDRTDAFFPNASLSKEKMGANLYAHYDFSEKSYIDVAFSTQKSSAQTIFMESSTTPLGFRESSTKNAEIRAKLSDFVIQGSFLNGTQDIYKGTSSPYKYDFKAIDGNLEYDFNNKKKNFSLRPGFNYQYSEYSDLAYAKDNKEGRGLLNATQNLSTLGVTLRSEYKPTSSTRIIAALRADKYNYPDDIYTSYQFIITQKLNENHIFRALTSRANRGSFMADIHTNLTTGGMLLVGNPDIKLPVMTLYEIGSRNKINRFLQTDIELFYSVTENFSGLEFESLDLEKGLATVRYRNYPTVAKQLGTTVSLNISPSKKLLFKVFTTIQKTTLEDYEQDKYDFTYVPLGASPLPLSDTISTFDHKSTPSVYGGINMTFKPTSKLTVFSNVYFYTAQEFIYQGIPTQLGTTINPTDNISAKMRMDLKVSYKVWKNNAIFINGKNIFNTQKNEFGFGESIGALYLIGLDFSF